jgi:putative cell wall-binding protein
MAVVRVRAAVVAGVLALVAALLVPVAGAQTDGCVEVVPVAEVTDGMVGRGLTVVEGSEPQEFTVEVLGVLDDGIGLDRDMIVVQVDAPSIDEAGGIWQGMSGSPVYVGDRLLGAVAYGLSFVSTDVGGLTPAEDMVELFDLPAPQDEPDFAAAREPRTADSGPIEVTGPLAREVLDRVGEQAAGPAARSDAPSVAFERLPLPLAVSGVSADRADLLEQASAEAGLDVRLTGGTRVGVRQGGGALPQPGGNLAAAVSLGDVTAAAVGTATAVCGDAVVGFGHPFGLLGPLGGAGLTADAITIIRDPGFAPYKLANLGQVFGRFDQDRLAGIRATTAPVPPGVTITSTVTDADLGRSRDGETEVLVDQLLGGLTISHLLANVDTVIDRIGPGTAELTYVVRGTGSRSGAFELRRSNAYTSPFDIAFESVFELLGDLDALQQLPVEQVDIEGIDVEVEVTEAQRRFGIAEVRVGVDGQPPAPSDGTELVVRPGSVLVVEVDLVGQPDDAQQTVVLELVVPDDAFGFGSLVVAGGDPFFGGGCPPEEPGCGGDGGPASVQELVEQLAARARNDQLTARLEITRVDGGQPPEPEPTATPEPPTPSPEPTPTPVLAQTPAPTPPGGEPPPPGAGFEVVQATAQLDRVVTGVASTPVLVDSPLCPGCPPLFQRLAGGDRIGTATAIARAAFVASPAVVLAPAGDYPAALVAGPLAAREGAPVLLTAEDQLSAGVADAVRELGAQRAILVGPDGQLGPAVEQALRDAGVTTVERIGGADRYEVAAAVAARLGGPRAWLVEGEHPDPGRGWPDAVSAGAVAAQEGAPILLTRAGDLPEATGRALDDLGTASVSIAGGEAAVGPEVAAAVAGRGIAVERIAGATRYETSVLLARRAVELGACTCNTWVVTGRAFPDALSAGPAVAWTGGVLVMVDGEDLAGSPPAADHFASLAQTAPVVTFVGGFEAISQQVEEQVFGLLVGPVGGGGQPPPEPTPEPAPEPSGGAS